MGSNFLFFKSVFKTFYANETNTAIDSVDTGNQEFKNSSTSKQVIFNIKITYYTFRAEIFIQKGFLIYFPLHFG